MRRPNTSFCRFPVVPVLRYTVLCCRANTSFGWCAEPAQRGGFVFPLLPVCFCRAVQADFVRCLLSVLFTLSAHRFLCVWSETVNLKVNTSVDESDNDLESIPCLGNSFTKNEQSLVGDMHDARIVAQGPRDQEICVCRVSCGKAHSFVFVSVLAHISILVPAVCVTRLCGLVLSRCLLAVLSVLLRCLGE